MKKVKIDYRKLYFTGRSEEEIEWYRNHYSEEEMIKGVDLYGDQVLVQCMDVKTENDRTEFVCRLCNKRITYHYCGRCGKKLDSLMKCEGSCGLDYKTNPPYCFWCYQPTVKICKICGNSVDICDNYCTFCGECQ